MISTRVPPARPRSRSRNRPRAAPPGAAPPPPPPCTGRGPGRRRLPPVACARRPSIAAKAFRICASPRKAISTRACSVLWSRPGALPLRAMHPPSSAAAATAASAESTTLVAAIGTPASASRARRSGSSFAPSMRARHVAAAAGRASSGGRASGAAPHAATPRPHLPLRACRAGRGCPSRAWVRWTSGLMPPPLVLLTNTMDLSVSPAAAAHTCVSSSLMVASTPGSKVSMHSITVPMASSASTARRTRPETFAVPAEAVGVDRVARRGERRERVLERTHAARAELGQVDAFLGEEVQRRAPPRRPTP